MIDFPQNLRRRVIDQIHPMALGDPEVPVFWRLTLMLVACYVAIGMTVGWCVVLMLEGLPVFLMFFPFGLPAAFFGPDPKWPSWAGHTAIGLAYSIYVCLLGILVFTPKRRVFWTAFLILLVLLALNVQGCHVMQQWQRQGLRG